jgi:membrane protease YdiL (CAAX protease family)
VIDARGRTLHNAAIAAFAVDILVFYVLVTREFIPLEWRVTVPYLARLAAAGMIACWLCRARGVAPRELGLSVAGGSSDAAWTAKVVGVLLAASVVLMAIGALVLRLVPAIPLPPLELRAVGTVRYLVDNVLLAAVVEELVYRSIMVPGLEAAYGRRGAIVAGAIVFYVLHLVYARSPLMVHYVAAGAILTWVFVERRKLWICVVLHAGGNLMVVIDDVLWLAAPDVYRAILGRAP